MPPVPQYTLMSGSWQTPVGFPLTPSGNPKQVAVDSQYLSKAEYIQTAEAMGLGITASHPLYTSGQLDKIILRASSYMNRFCGRYFDSQTIDETITGFVVRPFNPRLLTVRLNNYPLASVSTPFGINGAYIQVLEWFIQIDTSSANSYLQVFPDYGYYKIVPMLNNAGSGTGSPLPAEILDRVPLGVLWTNYDFGFGRALTSIPLTATDSSNKIFQAPVGYQLWSQWQPVTIFAASAQVASAAWNPTNQFPAMTGCTIDYVNGIVTLPSAQASAVTASFTTNETLPEDLKYACILKTSEMIGSPLQNPLGATNYSINSYSISFGNKLDERFRELVKPYKGSSITII